MDNEFILNRIFGYLPPKQWLLLETVSTSFQLALTRNWRSTKTLCLGDDFYQGDTYPTIMKEKDEKEICLILSKCGPYLNRFRLAAINARKPFFRNVRRFTPRYELSDKVFSAVCRFCHKLLLLDLSYHIFSSWNSFRILSLVPPSVEVLLLEICRLDESPPDENAMNELMNDCFDRLINLRTFSLWGSCYCFWTISDRDFSKTPSSLTYLDLSQGFSAKIGDLKSWISRLTNLQQLHLERTSINDADLHSLVDNCRQTLQGLTLAYAKSIIDFSPISSFRRLKYLRLDGNRDCFDDEALASICRSCTSLRLLSLENCNRLTVASLRKIGDLRFLKHLSLCSNLSLDDDCLAQICNYCSSLNSLQLKYCKKLTRSGLVHLPNLRKLRYLGVSGLGAFDQSIAECLRSRCKKLSTIEAFNCVNYQ